MVKEQIGQQKQPDKSFGAVCIGSHDPSEMTLLWAWNHLQADPV